MSGLLRYQLFLAYGLAFLAIWRAALKYEDDIAATLGTAGFSSSQVSLAVSYAPVWAILALGIYAVASIGYGVATFEDCPEAAKELDRQVKDARLAMEKKGVKL
mmetsp:Transcript_49079/g.90916  ORF Transcript_49079/g.90916 Transcript_49079/m.90916 type:complete len:104 (-) Transcript_49079:114-425(-)